MVMIPLLSVENTVVPSVKFPLLFAIVEQLPLPIYREFPLLMVPVALFVE